MSEAISERIARASRRLTIATGRAIEKVDAALAPAFVEVGSGVALYCGPGSPLTQASGLGHGRLDTSDLDRVEAFYGERCSDWEYVVTPFLDRQLISEVVQRGWRVSHFENVMALDLDGWPLPPRSEIQVTAVGDQDRAVWAEIGLRGFFGEEVPPEARNLGEVMAATEGTLGFLAWMDGVPVAAGTLLVSDDVAYLGGAATLPEHRKRGAQGALLAQRLAHAKSLGCSLAVCEALPMSQSQRNQERAGFRVLYTKVSLRRDPAEA